MIGPAWLFGVLGVTMFLLAALDQRWLWWRTAAWRFRTPEPNEPSSGRFAMNRVVAVAAGLGSVTLAIVLIVDTAGRDTSVLSTVRSTAEHLQQQEGGVIWDELRLETELNGLESNPTLSYQLASMKDERASFTARAVGGTEACLVLDKGQLVKAYDSALPGSYRVTATASEGRCGEPA